MTTLNQRYPIGSFVTTSKGVATVLGHDADTNRLQVLSDVEEWVDVTAVLTTAEVPDLNDPASIEEFLNAVDIHEYDKPPAASSDPCTCTCPPGACYRITSNGFHMTNGDCRCEENNCACL